MKILLTGFEPFNNTNINPSGEIIKELPEQIEGVTLIKEILPVEFKKAGFIHVPFSTEQKEVKKTGHFMELEDMVTAIGEVLVELIGREERKMH